MALFRKELGHSSCGGGAFYTRGIAKLYHLTFNIQYQVSISKSNLFFLPSVNFSSCTPCSGEEKSTCECGVTSIFCMQFCPPPIWKLRTSLEKPYIYPV